MFDAVSIFQNKVNLCSIKFCVIAVPGLISQEVHCSTHFFTNVRRINIFFSTKWATIQTFMPRNKKKFWLSAKI
jgi:hypothetical protein